MKRRRFPRWQRFPHRRLPHWWRGWFDGRTRITSEELDFIAKACYTPRLPTVALDRIDMPIMKFLMKASRK